MPMIWRQQQQQTDEVILLVCTRIHLPVIRYPIDVTKVPANNVKQKTNIRKVFQKTATLEKLLSQLQLSAVLRYRGKRWKRRFTKQCQKKYIRYWS